MPRPHLVTSTSRDLENSLPFLESLPTYLRNKKQAAALYLFLHLLNVSFKALIFGLGQVILAVASNKSPHFNGIAK